MTADGHDPFKVDENKALDALTLAWGDHYDIWILGNEWGAHCKDAPDIDVLTGDTPDALNRAIREDWARRNP